MRRYVTLKLKGFILISLLVVLVLPAIGCRGDGTNFAIPVYVNDPGAKNPAVVLTDLYVTPGWINVAVGDTQKLKAIGRFSDGHEEDYTGKVIWMIDGMDWTAVRGYFPTYGQLVTTRAGTLTINLRYLGEIHGHALVSVYDPMVDTPPKPPIDLDYTILPNDDVYLTWDIMSPPDPDLLGYVVYRSRVSGAQYQPLHYGALLNKFYRDSDAGGGVYYYVVTSIDLGGNESDYSFELTVDRR